MKGIKSLKELLDMGTITQEEFEQKKETIAKYLTLHCNNKIKTLK